MATFATRNPSDKSWNIALSNGNLTATHNATVAWDWVRSTIWKSSGKWYREITWTSTWSAPMVDLGIATSAADITALSLWENQYARWYRYNWQKANNNTYTNYWLTRTTNDVIGIALDMDAWNIVFYKNWVSQWTAFTWLSWTMYACCYSRETNAWTANFWASAFAYSVPSWYNPWLYTWTIDIDTSKFFLMF